MGQKVGAAVLRGLGQGLSLYQVASWSIQPLGHNRHGSKSLGAAVCLFWGGAGSPSNTLWPGPRPTATPTWIHPSIWPQYTNVTDRQWSDSIGRTVSKPEWWGAGMVICLKQCANDVHMVQLTPLPLHSLLLHQNPDWFNLSGASLTTMSWKRSR